jgi:hypothetical protein
MNIGRLLQRTPLQLLSYPLWQLGELAYDVWLDCVLSKIPPALVLPLVNRKLIREHKVYCGTDPRRAFYFSGSQFVWVYPKPDRLEILHASYGGGTRGDWYPACAQELEAQPLQMSRTRRGDWPNGKGAFPAPRMGASQ